MSVNQDIRDDLVSHDIDLRRVDGDTRKRVERRLNQLGKALKLLAIDIDPHGAQRLAARQRRLDRLDAESKVLINEAYKEINAMTQDVLRGLVPIESRKIVDTIQENLP